MNYDELSVATQKLTYRDKLRLAQLLIQLALTEEVAARADAQAAPHVHVKLDRSPSGGGAHGVISKVIDPSRPWVGRDYPQHRIFVLGESYTGTWDGDRQYDDVYMADLLAGKNVSRPDLFIRIAEKLQMSLSTLWHQVAFTNMALGSIGATNATKVTPAQLRAGQPRLESLFRHHEPRGVLVLGAKTGDAAAPVCKRLGIPYRTVYHPSGINNANPRTACTAEMLQTAWRELTCLEAQCGLTKKQLC